MFFAFCFWLLVNVLNKNAKSKANDNESTISLIAAQ